MSLFIRDLFQWKFIKNFLHGLGIIHTLRGHIFEIIDPLPLRGLCSKMVVWQTPPPPLTVHVVYGCPLSQVSRVYKGSQDIEFEWLVGKIYLI